MKLDQPHDYCKLMSVLMELKASVSDVFQLHPISYSYDIETTLHRISFLKEIIIIISANQIAIVF